MPLFPVELLPEDEHFEDLQPEQPTTDKVEPSAKGEKRKKRKSKSEKKKKAEKMKVEEKEVEEEHHVNSEAKQQSSVVGSQQRLPEVDQHSEAKTSTDKPEPSQEVLQDKDVVEEEVTQNEDDRSEKYIVEEDLLYGKNPNEEEKVSEEKDENEEGPEGQGQIMRKKKTTKRKVVPQATADMPVGTDPEPTISAHVEEDKADEGVSNVVGPKKKKQKVSPTAVRRSNRPRA
ncbi:hypothetical protein QL285_045637 [Trifolium repens]|nr:hypothetical protein QL285_045637 [Trifolium repens]